jgi:hypothetical protein
MIKMLSAGKRWKTETEFFSDIAFARVYFQGPVAHPQVLYANRFLLCQLRFFPR